MAQRMFTGMWGVSRILILMGFALAGTGCAARQPARDTHPKSVVVGIYRLLARTVHERLTRQR